jgi:hypothetical protein
MPGMIAHGEQDTYKDDPNDDIDVFFPDGRTVLPFLGKQAISDLYRIYFRGRPMMGEGSVLVDSPRGGDWKMIKPGV